jgi:hypothetical protein
MVAMTADGATARRSSVPAPLRGREPLQIEESSTDDGGQSVSVYKGGVVVVRIHGVIRQGAETNRVTRYLMDAVRNSPVQVQVFFDLKGFTHYDSDVRVRYTEAVRQPGDKVARIWVFADSRLVRMGTAVAALALRQLSLVERSLFDKELRSALGP